MNNNKSLAKMFVDGLQYAIYLLKYIFVYSRLREAIRFDAILEMDQAYTNFGNLVAWMTQCRFTIFLILS